MKLSPAGVVLDYFTPSNQGHLDSFNHDLGSANVTLLPDQPGPHPRLALMAGKNGTIHVVDRDNMGRYNPANDDQIVQSLVNIFPFGTPEPGNYSAAVYFNGRVYFSPVADAIQAFTLTNGRLSTSATSRSSDLYAYPGGTISITASGTSNGVLWAINWNGSSSRSTLRAYDATNLATELYNSEQVTGDRLDPGAKFTAPVIANGKVFVASSGRLTVFGLRP
jgi:outer membrane protein assembly factor BamB